MQVRRSYEKQSGNSDAFIDPISIDCAQLATETDEFTRDTEKTLNVVCVKYGTKYGADYVNKLY